MMWLWIGYIVGGFTFWITCFRIMASDPIMGVRESDSRHDAIATITLSGFASFGLAVIWPIVAVILAVWRYFVAPSLKKPEDDR